MPDTRQRPEHTITHSSCTSFQRQREIKRNAKRDKREQERRQALEAAQAAIPTSPRSGARLKRSEYIKAGPAGGSEIAAGVTGGQEVEADVDKEGQSSAVLKPLRAIAAAAGEDELLVDHLATR